MSLARFVPDREFVHVDSFDQLDDAYSFKFFLSYLRSSFFTFHVIGLTPIVVGLLQSLAQQSGTVSHISSGTCQSALTLSDVY